MLTQSRNAKRILLLSLITLQISLIAHARAAEGQGPSVVHGFLLNTSPTDYANTEKLFRSMKNGGANTIILRPKMDDGEIDTNALTNAVFLAHQEGLAIFVILPTRGLHIALREHPEWRDVKYDPGKNSMIATDRIDLFHAMAAQYITQRFKEIAAYSVDGILLDEDFFYGETEGMSDLARAVYRKKFGTELAPRTVFSKNLLDKGPERIEEYNELFWNWTDLKKNALALLFQKVSAATKGINKKIKLGVPLHIDGLMTSKEELALHAFDKNDYTKFDVDFFWISISHRDIRERQGLNYTKSMEMLSRIVQSSSTIAKDPSRTIFAIQTTAQSDQKLPISEIEDAVAMVRHAGNTGIAFMVNENMQLPVDLTRKIFTGRGENAK